MIIAFKGTIFQWRGPAPYLFVAVPEKESADIKAVSKLVTYGWGVIPVTVKVGKTEWKTSLFPRDGRYLVPIKMVVQKAEHLKEGDEIKLKLELHL
ncbi:MAG TPA: DUF1905 domain-containing protein [Anaerolineales bacterium]|nr:DUF1905 domain-containing protein [Anaerolineales bacterium]